uniref:F-box and regulator of chromosome condensation repeat protein n=1 Tax=Pithovirus LCPAC202 TaxID=2506592 RepID=A0A481Z7L0_9VIRU|nr:MAG: F-box and regulator of chromosome condensation repeat protein [Pithovirus LCPAC202]
MNRPIQTTTGRFGFTDLPNELLLDTFLRLDLKSLLAVCQSNQQMRSFCQDDFLWKQKFIQDFGSAPNLQVGEKWKDIYKTVFLMRPNSPISSGRNHYGVIDEKGLLYMAGSNIQSQLGFISNQKEFTTPVLVQVGPVGTKIISISCSFRSTIVVTDDGQVYGTGWIDLNLDGKRVDVRTFQKMNVSEKVRKVSHDYKHYIFLLRNGSVRMNGLFKIDTGSVYINIHVSSLIDIKAIDISVIDGVVYREVDMMDTTYHSTRYAIIDVNRNLYYWGNGFGVMEPDLNEEEEQDMIDNDSKMLMKVHYQGLIFKGNTANQITIQPIHIPIPEPVKQIALGSDHILILSSLGNVYVIGENHEGQLGIGDKKKAQLKTTEIPYKLTLPEKISSVVANKYTSAAISENGQVYIWGYNNEIISDLKKQRNILRRISYRKNDYFGGINIMKPIRINLDIQGYSHLDDTSMDKYEVVYLSLGPVFGIAVTKDGYLDVFGENG